MIEIPEHIFRGYDIRGEIGTELNERTVRLIAKGFVTMLYEKQIRDTVVGCDNRSTSDEFRGYFIDEVLKNGIDVYDIGHALSQMVYWGQYHFLSKSCAMITASHNPPNYNGFKLGRSFSDTFETDEIIKLVNIIKHEQFKRFDRQGKLVSENIFEEYKKDILKRVEIKKKFKVVVEGCNSYTGIFVPPILESLGCEVIRQNCEPDSSFPSGTPDPTERKVQQRLADRIVKENAEIGFSYDADGDRVGIVDGTGRLIWNDTLVALLASDVLFFNPGGTIVYNTLCSKQTDDVIRMNGGIPLMWKTGHSFIKAKIRQEKAAFGGELSGHIFFVDNFYGHDDGAFGTLRLLQYLSRTNQTLAEAVDKLPHYFSSPEIKLGCPDEIKFSLISDKVRKDLENVFSDARYVDIDGFRVDTENEMVIIRASQNGPYITVKFEAKEQEKYDELKKQIAEILHKYPEIDFGKGVNTDALK